MNEPSNDTHVAKVYEVQGSIGKPRVSLLRFLDEGTESAGSCDEWSKLKSQSQKCLKERKYQYLKYKTKNHSGPDT